MPSLVATVDCILVGAAIASFNNLVRVAQEDTTNQQQMVWQWISYGSFELGNSFPEENSANQTAELSKGQSF